MPRSCINAYTMTCAAGTGLAAVRESIANCQTGLRYRPWEPASVDTWLGIVDGVDKSQWSDTFNAWDSRNNRLAWLGIQQDGFLSQVTNVISNLGPARVGIIVGTSTASIGRTEEAYAALTPDGRFSERFIQPGLHNPHSTSAFLADVLGIGGPVMTMSTACSSSAKVLASAHRWLQVGIVDAVIVGGVDSLCRSTIYGFESLQLLSRGLCRPFDASRDGLNIGEAAAFALVSRDSCADSGVGLLGYGESCDAHHMSSPHPEGLGARLAMEKALVRSGMVSADIDYVNVHGTGTRNNDVIEAMALARVLGRDVHASSTKGWTGHTLGAAGLLEALIAADTLGTGLLPGNLNLETLGDDIVFPIVRDNRKSCVNVVMSASFGFGGSNCVLILGRDS